MKKKGRRFKNELLSLFFVYSCWGICRKLLFNKECLFRLADDASFLLPGVLFFLKIMSIFRILFLYLGMFLDFLLWYNIKDVLLLEIDVF